MSELKRRQLDVLRARHPSLVVFVAGSGCLYKSRVARELARRLHVPRVLQTSIIESLLFPEEVGRPFYETAAKGDDDAGFVQAYQSRCEAIRRGLQGDIDKAVKDNKWLIVNGFFLDPALFSELLAVDGPIIRWFTLTASEANHRVLAHNRLRNAPEHAFGRLRRLDAYLVGETRSDNGVMSVVPVTADDAPDDIASRLDEILRKQI